MGQAVRQRHESVETELATYHSVFCFSGRYPADHLHDQHSGIGESLVSQDHQESRRLPKRRGGDQAAVSGDAKHDSQVGNGAALERGLESVLAIVGRPHTRGDSGLKWDQEIGPWRVGAISWNEWRPPQTRPAPRIKRCGLGVPAAVVFKDRL